MRQFEFARARFRQGWPIQGCGRKLPVLGHSCLSARRARRAFPIATKTARVELRPLEEQARGASERPQLYASGHQRQESLLRLHVWISAWRARRWNDFEMTAARRRDLHVPVDPGRRADDALRLGEFVTEWCRTATAHRWRLALDIRRTGSPFVGRRIPGRLRQRRICRSDADERCNDQDGGTQRQLLTDLRSVLFNVWAR